MLEKHKEDMQQNEKNVKYYKDLILYFNKLR
jgi:hypothetical protein